MNILITNDDGYKAKGINTLAGIMKKYGNLTVIAPKYPQSGMSMACALGYKPVAVKTVREEDGDKWIYVDGTPATCVKWGVNMVFTEKMPDLVVSGINHGSNAASAELYSGTIGAVKEAILNGIPAIGVSIDKYTSDADFSTVEKYFPQILESIMASYSPRKGVFYNVNFPDTDQIKGVRVAHQGFVRWVKEFNSFSMDIYSKRGIEPSQQGIIIPEVEEGEEVWYMTGEIEDLEQNPGSADHSLMLDGYITITIQNIDCTDYKALAESESLNRDF